MINIKNLQLSFGEKIIFRNLDLQVKDNARIGLVGVNGAGKTTLLRIITGELESDSGIIERSKNLTVGYLPQDLVELEPVPLMQYLRDRAGLSQLESRLRDIENKLAANPDNHEALLNEHSRLEHKFESIGGFAFESEAHRV
ncbi:MAG: ABC-F family ATP-binding cassette domain-containing protein, partial [Synergistaceae bacterium]|nr:ABC-F family ATP-binding cassette domain-containing protein [Synergistaceae bacterium]